MTPIALLLAASLPAAEGVKFLEGTFDDALQAASKTEKLIFVDFYTDT
ncbi:MAG: hypothetical protein HY721_19485 [Planctomycetes bacterium]|nr:hypothetical protein [Planctomycetota bacterium]